MPIPSFEWDEEKNFVNQKKHGVSFEAAQNAFDDPKRIIIRDLDHEKGEKRFFCLGLVERGLDHAVFLQKKAHTNLRSRILEAREETL
jgi:uncharacterized DUF497 family protein